MAGECFRRLAVFLRKADPPQGQENGKRKGIGKSNVFMGIISAFMMVAILGFLLLGGPAKIKETIGLLSHPTPRCIWKHTRDGDTGESALVLWCPSFQEIDYLSVAIKKKFGLKLPFHPDLFECKWEDTDRMPSDGGKC